MVKLIKASLWLLLGSGCLAQANELDPRLAGLLETQALFANTQLSLQGNANIIALQQVGSGNVALLQQQGNNNQLSLEQQGVNNMAVIDQQGDKNLVNIRQIGNDNLINIQQLGSNSFSIEQIGAGAELTITQY